MAITVRTRTSLPTSIVGKIFISVFFGIFLTVGLGITFDVSGPEVKVYHPDGRPFLTFEELAAEHDRAQREPDHAARRAIRLAELGRKARTHRATAGELAELETLENETLARAPARKAGA